jgi:hypothetical protein
MTKFISVTWSEGVSEHESQVFVDAIDRVLKWLYLRHPDALVDPPIQVRVFGNWVIPGLLPDRPYWGTQWYIDTSLSSELGRVITPTFLELVRQEPWQRPDPHFDLALLEQDLTDFPVALARLRPDHYTLGSSLPGLAAVMSVHRLRQLDGAHTRDLALRRLVHHHLGHTFGVPSLVRSEEVARLGLEMHCTNRCAMRQASTEVELVALALEEEEMGWPFCERCTTELHSIVLRYAQNWS